MTCLTAAACNPQYEIAKLDVKGAFIQTEMSGTSVYVKCTGKLSDKILKIFPSMETYLGSDRILYGLLRKALYGCVQASRLWYLKLSQFLKGIGYVNSEMEPCVFRKVEGEIVYLLIVYVDDVLIIATAEEIKHLHELCIKEFRWVMLDTGKRHSYLGMKLEFLVGKMRIDLSSYTEKVLDFYAKVMEPRRAPGKKGVFLVSETSVVVSPD
jgi:hypothetical protein